MMKHLNFLFFLFFIGGLHSYGQSGLSQAEDFMVKDLDGHVHTLYSYLEEGKIVVLPFFTTSCGSCSTFTPEIVLSYNDFGCNQGDVFYLGVNWGANNIGLADFMLAHEVEYPCASGLEGMGDLANEQYEIASYITTLVILPDGTIAGEFYGPNAYPTRDSLNSLLLNLGAQMQNCTVGINTTIDLESPQIKFSSSPDLHLILKNFAQGQYDLNIFNISGQPLWSESINIEEETKLNLLINDYSPGIYIIRISNQQGLIYTQKLNVQ